MNIDWRVVPIETWPAGELTEERKSHPFRKSVPNRWGGGTHTVSGIDWTSTTELLERELRMLDAEHVVLQMAVGENQIRQDGWVYANARPEHPGVVLTFDSKHGPLSYPCDTFTDWQANIRAIALALEALRKVDRYGVTKTGEQYRGWKQLPPAGGSTTTMTAEVAARVLADAAYRGGGEHHAYMGAELVLESPEKFRQVYREAARATHPDGGGQTRDFQAVQEARQVLEAHHDA